MSQTTEADATTRDGTAYQSLTADKSGGHTTLRDLFTWGDG